MGLSADDLCPKPGDARGGARRFLAQVETACKGRRRTKTQASLPSEEAVLFLLFGLLRSGQVRLRRLVGWQDLTTSQVEAA